MALPKRNGQPEITPPTLHSLPLINGGLFDCFTDNPNQRRGHSIPNRLFLDNNRAAQPGILNLLDRYPFTIEENPPIEQEVALDPELLGKGFENLLAAYNPETRDTARKQTGAYYTPRPVMVEQQPSPQENFGIKPLPNLETRFLSANDLLSLAQQLAKALREAGFSSDAPNKIANWNPYDPNEYADWFAPKYMFNIPTSFDIILANPPYIQRQKNKGQLA